MTSLVRCALVRTSKSCSDTKITPVLGALVKVAPSKPTNATAFLTPGREWMISLALRMIASERSRVEPGGNEKAAMK